MALLGLVVGASGCSTERPAEKAEAVLEAPVTAGYEPAIAAHAMKPIFRPNGTAPAVWGPGDLYNLLATGEETNNAFFQFEATVPAGGGPPPHIHNREDESFLRRQRPSGDPHRRFDLSGLIDRLFRALTCWWGGARLTSTRSVRKVRPRARSEGEPGIRCQFFRGTAENLPACDPVPTIPPGTPRLALRYAVCSLHGEGGLIVRLKLNHILCCTDLSDASNHALPYAMSIAGKFNAKLHVGHVTDVYPIALYSASNFIPAVSREEILREAEGQIRRLLSGQAAVAEPIVRDGSPALEISRIAEEVQADLAVLATHGRSGVKRLLLGSVAERLLETLPCPALVIKSPERKFLTPWPDDVRFRRILIGCDFSPDSALALEYGLALGQEFQAEVHLVHVFEPSVYWGLDSAVKALVDDLERAVREVVEKRLLELVPKEASTWCRVEPVLRSGAPHEEISRHAQALDVDLIVLGLRGHGLVDRLLVGSTAYRVVRNAHCPVLVARRGTGKERPA
jgi:nucleotide-binding universal stress UspA family protein